MRKINYILSISLFITTNIISSEQVSIYGAEELSTLKVNDSNFITGNLAPLEITKYPNLKTFIEFSALRLATSTRIGDKLRRANITSFIKNSCMYKDITLTEPLLEKIPQVKI
jgi:hypothetical protein